MGRVILLALSMISFPSLAKKIQWASYVEFQYNQFGETDSAFSAYQVLGRPDAFPQGKELHANAFRLENEKDFGSFVVGFDKPQSFQEVIIIESAVPGRIFSVSGFDTENRRIELFQGIPKRLEQGHRAAVFRVPKTEYRLAKIEINLSCLGSPGWSQIDAVGISDFGNISDLYHALSRHGDFKIEQQVTFAGTKENLGARINTSFTETKPIISSNGTTLYFARQFSPQNHNGTNDFQDIYCSYLIDNEWSEAINLKGLNNELINGVCSVSPDGNVMLLINDQPTKGEPGVCIRWRTEGGWSAPQALDIDNFYNFSQFQDYFLSADGNFLLLCLERIDSQGKQDLYVSFRNEDNSWSKPLNLGDVVNTPGFDFAPFLAPDNKTLYFASDGHGGYGASDIFYTKRLDDTWRNWLSPQNMGGAVNTENWDSYYSISDKGDYAYFVSNQGRFVFEDVYRIPLPYEFKPEPTQTAAYSWNFE